MNIYKKTSSLFSIFVSLISHTHTHRHTHPHTHTHTHTHTSIFKCMKKITSTMFDNVIKYIIYFMKFWFIKFIFFNNGQLTLVHYTIHLLGMNYLNQKYFQIKIIVV